MYLIHSRKSLIDDDKLTQDKLLEIELVESKQNNTPLESVIIE
jgi:hypothetical protein